MADWWSEYEGSKSEPDKGEGWWSPYEDKAKSGWHSLVDHVTSDLATVGEGATHALPNTIGFLGDIANLAMKGVGTNPLATATLTKDDIPGMGPASRAVNKSYDAAEQSLPADQVPLPKNREQRYANAIGSGVGSMLLLGGPKNVGSAVLSGIGQGVGGEAAHDLFPNSEWAPLIGSVVGGGIGVVPHIASTLRTGSLIRQGMSHPDYESLVQNAIVPLEGGGSLEHPLVNAKSGAEGVMQVTPETARDPGYGIRPWDGKSQADLARVGRQKFAVLLGKYNDPEKALAAYNWGEGNLNKAVAKYGDAWYDHAPEETQGYVAHGMTRVYGGPLSREGLTGPPGPDGLPTNGSVSPIDAGRMANIMQDQGMMDALNKETPEAPTPDGEDAYWDSPAGKEANRQEAKVIGDLARKHGLDWDTAAKMYEEGADFDQPHLTPNDNFKDTELTPAEQQEMDASAPKPQIVTTADEAHVPAEGPPEPANDTMVAEAEPPSPKPTSTKGQSEPQVPNPSETPTSGQPPLPPREPPKGGDGTGGEGGGDLPTPIEKLNGIIDDMDKLRKEQDNANYQIRRQRMQEAGKRSQRFTGESGAAAKMGALQGKMIETKIRSYRPNFSQEDLDSLFNHIQNHPAIDWQTNLHATTGLQKLLFPVGNKLPTASELKALRLVFPKETLDGLKKHSSLGEIITNTLSVPRALMASADFSAPLRQGVFMVGRKEFYGAAKGMFGKAFSQKDFDAMQSEIASRPTYGLMQEGGLSLTDVTQDLTKREEAFMSNYAEKAPGIGRIVKASDRAYIAFLNKVRADVFDNLVKRYEELHGESISENPKALKDLAGYVNNATGRGSLGKFTQSAPFLSAGLFAPRLIASRLTLLNPLYYARLDPFVRREALKDLFKFAGTALTVLTLAKMGGASVDADPRSTDFGKIRIRDTRFDILGGFQQYIRTFAQIIMSQSKNAETGKITNLVGGMHGHVLTDKLGLTDANGTEQSPFKPTTALDEGGKLIINKAAPVPGLVLDLMRGSDSVGQKLDWKTTDQQTMLNFKNPIFQRVTPLVIQDTLDAYKEYGKESGITPAVAATGILGVGTQTYEPVKHEHKAKASKDWWSDFESGSGSGPKIDKDGNFK